MALDLTTNAQNKLNQVNLSTQLIVKIEEIPYIFGAQAVGEFVRIGQENVFINTNSFFIGGIIPHNDSRDWISLDGTTTSLSQQLKPDLSTSSVTTMNVSIVNVSEQLSTWFSPGGLVDDLLGRKVDVFLSLDGLAYPDDAVRIFAGIISTVSFQAGKAIVQISHPEQLKRQKIFPEFKTQLFTPPTTAIGSLTADINESTPTIPVNDGTKFTASTSDDLHYIEINSEKMKITNVVGNNLTVTRAQLNTGATTHSTSDEVKEVYGLSKTDTKVKVTDVTNFVTSSDIVTSHITVNEEAMKVTAAANTEVGGVVQHGILTVERKQFNTVAFFHEQEDDVESFYRVQGPPIDVALKTLLSNGGTSYLSNISVKNFEEITTTSIVENAFTVPQDPQKEYGLVVGDTVTITGASISGNNVTNATILGFGKSDPNHYIIIGTTLTEETSSSAIATFKSQYNTLTRDFCLALTPQQVDVEQHINIKENYASAFPDVDLIIKEQTDGQEFINRLIYRPYSIYSIPRKGKVSCNITVPPLGDANTKYISTNNVLNADKINIKRNINDKFFNAVVFRYHPDVIEDDLKAGFILKSEESENRIPIGNRPITIDARALRRSNDVTNHVKNISARIIERYKFSAEYLQVSTNYKTGMPIDIGDTVVLQGDNLKITDTKNPGEVFIDRIMECQNKTLDIKTGKVSLTLVDTTYSAQQRYGVISPGSKIAAGASTTIIPLKVSYASLINKDEQEKWLNYIDKRITIRNDDFSYNQTTFIRSITSDLKMTVDTLSSPPSEDFFCEVPEYAQTDAPTDGQYKARFVYFNPSVEVVSGASQTQFTVSSSDALKFVKGNIVVVMKSDFSELSSDIEVSDISGTTITLKSSIGFTPSNGDRIEKIGFKDGGLPYAHI